MPADGEDAPMMGPQLQAGARPQPRGLRALAAAAAACASCGALLAGAGAVRRWGRTAGGPVRTLLAGGGEGLVSQAEYRCDEGTDDWQDGWSPEKQAACCEEDQQFCTEFDCDEGLANFRAGWSKEKKSWCCEKESKGCVEFNCNSGYANWREGWSQDKKRWCCEQKQKGCKGDTGADELADQDEAAESSAGKSKIYGEDSEDDEQHDYIINLPPSWSMDSVRAFQEKACKKVEEHGGMKCDAPADGGGDLRAVQIRASAKWVRVVMDKFIEYDAGFDAANSEVFAERDKQLSRPSPLDVSPDKEEDGSSASFKNVEKRSLRDVPSRELHASYAQCYYEPGTKCVEQLKSQNLWGLDRLDGGAAVTLDNQYEVRYRMGEGVHVYVLDTGIKTTHREFRFFGSHGDLDEDFRRAIPTIDVTSGTLKECDPTDRECAVDRNGHGTHVSATIGGVLYGVAKYATLHACKVLDDNSRGTVFGFMRVLSWVQAKAIRPAVVSASLSAPGESLSIERVIDSVTQAGITVVVASGNQGKDACAYFPGNVGSAITVGATDKDDRRARFSNTGSCLDIFAPGKSIMSAGISRDNAHAVMSGTSMAAPHVAGVVAMVLWERARAGEAELQPREVAAALASRAVNGVVQHPGDGAPNKMLQYRLPPMSDIGGSQAELDPAPTPSTTTTPAPAMPAETPAPTLAPATPAPTPAPTLAENGESVPFNCRSASGVDYAVGWTQAKRDHCCELERMGCVVDPFDCNADFPNWRIGWSDGKKTWCCIAYKRGC